MPYAPSLSLSPLPLRHLSITDPLHVPLGHSMPLYIINSFGIIYIFQLKPNWQKSHKTHKHITYMLLTFISGVLALNPH